MIPLAYPLAAITPSFVGGLKRYVRAWHMATEARGPYRLTRDNFVDTIADLYATIDEIEDPEAADGWLSLQLLEGTSRYFVRDAFFLPGPIRVPDHVRCEAKPRHKLIASVLAGIDPRGLRKFGLDAPIHHYENRKTVLFT